MKRAQTKHNETDESSSPPRKRLKKTRNGKKCNAIGSVSVRNLLDSPDQYDCSLLLTPVELFEGTLLC